MALKVNSDQSKRPILDPGTYIGTIETCRTEDENGEPVGAPWAKETPHWQVCVVFNSEDKGIIRVEKWIELPTGDESRVGRAPITQALALDLIDQATAQAIFDGQSDLDIKEADIQGCQGKQVQADVGQNKAGSFNNIRGDVVLLAG